MQDENEGYEIIGEPQVSMEPEPAGEIEQPVVEPQAEPTEPEVEPDHEDEEEEDRPKKKSGSAKARERAIRAEERNRILEERLAALEGKTAPQPIKADQPSLDDFETYDQYNEALVDYRVKKALENVEKQREQQTVEQTWQKKFEAAEEKYEDFRELIADAPPPPAAIRDLLTGPDVSLEAWHFLLTHPKKHAEINRLSPMKAAIELGKIEVQLSQPKPTKTTNAPPPIAPARAGVVATKAEDGYVPY